jgi:CheY-like chemotaxis protein
MDITELTQAQKALKEADRRKDEFLAMLAHELRNPLAAISSANELLQQVGSQDPMARRARDAAARQTAHMARLLDDLLDVARVTQRKVTLNKTDVSLLSVLESAVEASNPAVNTRMHRLYVSHPREPMRVHGDPVRLAQAIGNLVDNAAKYTPPGGEIYLSADREGEQAVICVRDNGKGIEPELLPHVFELFVQGSRSADRAEGGLGLGLTLVRSIVELHSGRVEGCSEGPGRGSEFRIWLPLLSAAKEHATEKKPGGKEARRPLRILVVDDNADSAELLAALLQIQGHEVMTANSGPAAIELALTQMPEVALMDIGMPGMDGFEVAKRFRASQQLKHIALVAVSGYGQQEDIEKSREAGFDDHLVKPVGLESLGQVLKRLSSSSTERS